LIQFDSIQQLSLYDDPVLVTVASSCNPDDACYRRFRFCNYLQRFEYWFRWSNNNDFYVLMLMLMLMLMRFTSIALVSISVDRTQVHSIQFKFHHNMMMILLSFSWRYYWSSTSKIPFDSSHLSCCCFALIGEGLSVALTVTSTDPSNSSPSMLPSLLLSKSNINFIRRWRLRMGRVLLLYFHLAITASLIGEGVYTHVHLIYCVVSLLFWFWKYLVIILQCMRFDLVKSNTSTVQVHDWSKSESIHRHWIGRSITSAVSFPTFLLMMLLLLLFDNWYSSDLCVTTVLASLLPAKSNPHSIRSSLMFEVSLPSHSFDWYCRFLTASSRIHATTSDDSSIAFTIMFMLW